ncbi:MAG: phage Gp37/Gp68 family protein [Chloroflexi bacterium]|nr:phage Gp37/Gp68 family protein [Chloroflexota bacterium]
MPGTTAIEWTNKTWNPVTGCTKVSPGCDHCYAERLTQRFGRDFTQVTLHPERLTAPLHWRQPSYIFVNSMSDLFHSGKVPYTFVDEVFDVIRRCPQHTFQILTKRPSRMLRYPGPWPANAWAGVSVESQRYAWRIDVLRKVPAAVRFLSIEPLIGPIADLNLHDIHWVIVGGESGPGHRPIDPCWVRTIRDQCIAQKVPFFFKQWGGLTPKWGGRLLDGRTWDEMPACGSPSSLEVPNLQIAAVTA